MVCSIVSTQRFPKNKLIKVVLNLSGFCPFQTSCVVVAPCHLSLSCSQIHQRHISSGNLSHKKKNYPIRLLVSNIKVICTNEQIPLLLVLEKHFFFENQTLKTFLTADIFDLS